MTRCSAARGTAIALVLVAGLFSMHRPAPVACADPPAAAAIPFNVPPGFVAEKVAGPPLVEHPMFAGFDDRGRLYVADSGGKNLKADDLLKELPSCIRVLEDTDGDGVFDKSKVFADRMSFPMGVLWHEGHVYCCSPPSLWRLTDTNGDDVADARKELVTKFGFIGNAADIHGPWLGPDGRLYWSDGRHGHEIKKPDGTILTKGKAARVFRCKTDGSEVEVVCGGGMDDPVQIAFTEEGEPFCVVDIFQARPTRQDALIYCIDGGVFPYYEAVLGEFKRTGPLLPAVSELGWVAPSGLIRYRGGAFGKEFTDTLLSTQFNTHKIVRHTLQRVGAGFTSKDEEFITSANPDFHPTSLVEDADGSLLVIDTGGWFRIGCPTSQVAKPEIKGGIYRVRRQGAPKVEDPRGLKIPWRRLQLREVAKLLDDPRFVVRDRAVAELSRWSDDEALKVMKQAAWDGESPRARINAIWALSRVATDKSHEPITERLKDRDSSVRQVAARALGIHRDYFAFVLLSAAYNDPSASVRREASIALGRCSTGAAFGRARGPVGPATVKSMLLGLQRADDPFQTHACIHALIENHDPTTRVGLLPDFPAKQRGALIALDQMDNGNLTKEDVLPFLLAEDRPLQQAAWEIVLKRPAWLGDVAELIRKELQANLTAERQDLLRDALTQASSVPAVGALIAGALKDDKTSAAGRVLLLDVIASANVAKTPPAWDAAVKAQLARKEPAVVRQALRAIQVRGLNHCDAELKSLIDRDAAPADLRLAALAVVAPRLKELPQPLFDFTLAHWADDSRTAAEVLGKAVLNEGQLLTLAGILPRASALEMPRLLDAFRQSSSAKVGHEVVRRLGQAPALPAVAPADLRAALANFPAEVRTATKPLFKKLAVDEAAQRKKLAEFAGVSEKASPERGRLVFFSKKALCSACHAIKGEGERIGPDLSRIGSIRTEADLLEAILFPSNSIARGFESVTVELKDGRGHSGLVRRETADALYIVTPERAELRLPRAGIESVAAGRTSIMPQGLEAALSPQELGDLVAYLHSLR